MRKFALLWGLGVLLLVGPANAEPEAATLVNPNAKAVVKVGQNDNYFCSGFHLDDYIVTAAHCVERGKMGDSFQISLPDGTFTKATLIVAMYASANLFDDVALLELARNDFPSLVVDCRLPKIGTKAYHIGYPLMLGEFITEGMISGLPSAVPDLPPFPLIVAQIGLSPGDSGGPLFDERTNMVIGIGEAVSRNVNFFTPMTTVCALLHW